MKHLVTGGAGFIASHISDALIKQGDNVVVIDDLSTGKKKNINPKARFYKVDILDQKIAQIFKKEKPDVVFHYAAQINLRQSVEDPVQSAKTNILGSLNILENCKSVKVKKIIFASTGGAMYGDAKIIPTPEDYFPQPVSPYGIEKLIIEHYLDFYKKEYHVDYLVLRLANVYGPRQNSKGEAGVVAIFCDKILSKKQAIIYGDGKQTRDFVFIDDVVKASLLGLKKDVGGIFNIATSQQTSVNTLFLKLKNLLNTKSRAVYGEYKSGEQQRSCLDIKKSKTVLHWNPQYSLEDGLKVTANWFKDQS